VFEENIANIKKAVDFTMLKGMLGKWLMIMSPA
jgi:hypothetical protein